MVKALQQGVKVYNGDLNKSHTLTKFPQKQPSTVEKLF